MIYPASRKPFEIENFVNPPTEYRGIPFWAWNCRVTDELVREQTRMFHDMGMGGAMVHPRTGMDVVYMSEEYLRLVALAVSEFKSLGMKTWLYDEERFPSGAAGGLVTRDARFRSRHLLLTKSEKPELARSREEFDRLVEQGRKPGGYYLDSYTVELDSAGRLARYSRGGGPWKLYVRLMEESAWFNGETYVDVFNPRAIDKFIAVTHERYARGLAGEFGASVPAIFTDEPHMKGKFALPFAAVACDATIAYTDDMDETFRLAYGVSLLDVLPEILWELPGGRVSAHRYHYHDHVTERFVESYSDRLGAWCEDRGIAFTGHYLSERTLYSQTLALGETMRQYRSQQLPGVDILADQKELSTLKQAQSVMRQMNREGLVSELYGVTHWDFDFKGHKLQGDWQAALGVSVRVHHLSLMSMGGEAKRDWPASIAYQSPWYKKYPYIEDHFARVNSLMTRGRDVCRVAVIHPIESFWLKYGPVDQTQEERDQMDADFESLCQWLLYGCVDFDFISEALLTDMFEARDGKFRVGNMAYDVVLAPKLLTVRSTTLNKLGEFASAGGRVIALGAPPRYVDALESEAPGRVFTETIPFARADILLALKEYRDVEIRSLATGKLSDNLFYRLREEGEKRYLFICHVNRNPAVPSREEKYQVTLPGAWRATYMDTLTGITRPADARLENGVTRLRMNMFSEDSALFMLEPGAPIEIMPSAPAEFDKVKLSRIERYSLSEPNALILDFCEWALDDDALHPLEYILKADDLLRDAVNMPRRKSDMTQPWLIPNERAEHTARLVYRFNSDLALSVRLALEGASEAQITLNGERVALASEGYFVDKSLCVVSLPPLKAGENELEVVYPFTRRSNLECMYLLGDFGVIENGLVAPLETLEFGDITRERLPFYTGNVDYELSFELERDAREVVLEVPHFAAPVIEAFIDGREAGIIAFAPHRASLGALTAGRHSLVIRLYGNRFNAFGTLHNANPAYKWYGPDSYRTEGGEWTDSYLVRPAGVLTPVNLLVAR